LDDVVLILGGDLRGQNRGRYAPSLASREVRPQDGQLAPFALEQVQARQRRVVALQLRPGSAEAIHVGIELAEERLAQSPWAAGHGKHAAEEAFALDLLRIVKSEGRLRVVVKLRHRAGEEWK